GAPGGSDAAFAGWVDDPASLTRASLSATYVQVAGASGGKHAQIGPTTKTLNVAGAVGSEVAYSVLGFQNNDPAAPDSGTRLYIVPRKNTHPTTGVGGALKIFGDDYFADDGSQANYRDFGIYFHANQGGTPDTGTNGAGVFWLNSKVSGTWANKNPDIGFSFDDGLAVGGRFALVYGTGGLAGQFWPVLVIGAGKPDASKGTTVVGLEMQKDIAFNGAGRGFRWLDDAATPALTNLVQLNPADWQVKLGGTQQMMLTKLGALVHGSTQLGAATTDGFFYVRSISGAPTGVPTARTGTVPMTVDPTAGKLWAYVGGTWKGVTLT
ncbi:MAG: hypothetical protein ACRD0P_34940, partial [Stackebrandtia sp.]